MLAVLLVSVCASAQAKIYYLKFEASGATHDSVNQLSANSEAWIKVSIVDSHPTNGPVHWENSDIGSWTKDLYSGSGKTLWKNRLVNNYQFYYANVPRSITIINNDNGNATKITAGDAAQQFNGAPSFLSPDGLLVAPGMARQSNGVLRIYVAAATRIKSIPYETAAYGYKGFPKWIHDGQDMDSVCLQGWTESMDKPTFAEIWQAVKYTESGFGAHCTSTLIYHGNLSHIVLEE